MSRKRVVNIDDARPHVVVRCSASVHVLPMSLINDIINGKRCITDIDEWREIIIALTCSDESVYADITLTAQQKQHLIAFLQEK